ncbi:hypothetical protein KC926_01440 [Candidatus Kaiserbacteria bacterium]|nr:hypothetical protein [Candidatus Kaiserbacteria bacterium]
MRYILAILIFITITLSIMQSWLFLALGLAIYSSFKYTATPLIFLAVLLDAYYGAFHTFPVLTGVSIFWFVLVEYISPRLMALHT